MSPCGWAVSNCACGTCWNDSTPAVQATASALAIMTMWAATGRQYGKCELTVQPCSRQALLPDYQTYPVAYEGLDSGPYISGGEWHNSCDTSESPCSCSPDGRCSVLLQGPTTKADITSVTVAGVLVPAASYVVVNGNTLVRTDGTCWPTCSSLTSQAPPDFVVVYDVGLAIPDAVQAAVERLACEYAKACTGGPCALPQNLRSLTRQGVEIQIADFPDDPNLIRTGIRMIDNVIIAVNPHNHARRPSVMSPDLPLPRRMV